MSSRASQASGSSRSGRRQPTAPAVQYPAGYVPRRRGPPLQAEDTLTDTEEDTVTEGGATEPLLNPACSIAQPPAAAVPTSGQGLLSSAGRGRPLASGARRAPLQRKTPAPTLSKAAQDSARFLESFPSRYSRVNGTCSSEQSIIRDMHERIIRRVPSPLGRDKPSIVPQKAALLQHEAADTPRPVPPFPTISEQWLRDQFTQNTEQAAVVSGSGVHSEIFQMTGRKLLRTRAKRFFAWCDKQRKAAEENEKLAKRLKLEAATSAHDSEEVTSISELAQPSDIGGRSANQGLSDVLPSIAGVTENHTSATKTVPSTSSSLKRKATEIETENDNVEVDK